MKRAIHKSGAIAVCGALAASVAIAACGGSGSTAGGSTASGSTDSSSGTLVVESSQQNTITKSFNPFVSSSAAALLGATSLIYEPLLQANVVKPGQYYHWLATGYKWGNGGKAITFTIRKGVKWSNGSPLTPADVAFTYELMKKDPDVNTVGLDLTSATTSGDTVTLNFPTAQYANLQNIAGQVYIVPKAIWSKVGDPAKYIDANPVGTGPYTLKNFSSQGISLGANPHYWGGTPHVATIEFPTYGSGNAALSALETGQLDWAGNFISGIQKVFEAGNSNHKVWFPPVQTNSLEPNLSRWPTNQLPVRKAISLALDRQQIGAQGEQGLEPPVKSMTGLTLPVFNQYQTTIPGSQVSTQANPAAAEKALESAGYTKNSQGYFEKDGREVTIAVTDPSNYNDYDADDVIIAKDLKAAGINASYVGQSDNAWAADVADGNFQLTNHWSQTSVSPYQLYNDWLNGALATKTNRAGNYEGLKNSTVDAALAKAATANGTAALSSDLAPVEKYVAQDLPVIPTVYGTVFDEYNTSAFTGWPNASNEYESGSPNAPTNEVVILHLKPVS